jgi:hypothetical protein
MRWLAAALLALAAPASGRAQEAADSPGNASPVAEIDRAIAAAWADAGIKPSPVATDAEFLRRAYLDLLGRIPSVDEASAFLASKEPAKRAKLVELLLAHPDYPKHFATVWRIALVGRRMQDRELDRNALEGWLRRQFADNRPWNEVVVELVTAAGSNKENGAVNFTIAHLGGRDRGGSYDAVNLTSATTRLFLGQQIQCTQCHDHPSNDWKQADFWGINAFFKGVRKEEVRTTDAAGGEAYDHTEITDEPTELYATYERRNAIVGIAFPTFLDGRKISQGTDVHRRAELAKFLAEKENAQLARAFVNRMWGHFLGRGFTNPVDDFGDHNPPSHPELLDALAKAFGQSSYDVKALVRWITASRAYGLTSAATKDNAKDETLFSRMQLKPMTPEQLFDSLLVATAAHKAGGDAEVDRTRDQWLNQFVVAFGNDDGEETSTFQGTIPQALMMMNGPLMAKATGGQRGSFLAKLRDGALARRRAPAEFMLNGLYLAALSRYPTPGEVKRMGAYLGSSPDTLNVMEDIFWALLNSNEFILNH